MPAELLRNDAHRFERWVGRPLNEDADRRSLLEVLDERFADSLSRSDQRSARWGGGNELGARSPRAATRELGPIDVVVVSFPADAPMTGEAVPRCPSGGSPGKGLLPVRFAAGDAHA